ncbi:MAG: hypothetical protein AAGF23_04695, partial [Acidobacteriota bacterium]
PRWAFYPPVVLYVLWLSLRHRSPTLFTAANPAIPAGGGFVGESKSSILRGLGEGHVAPWAAVEPGGLAERRRVILDFVERGDAPFEPGFPVVLKPDVGERGDGVAVVRRADEVGTVLEKTPGPVIVQRFVEGPELGVFWLLPPGAGRGQIFSITDKVRPSLAGDGTSTLRRLVFADSRAVALADTYLEALGDRADHVPAAGESVELVDLGTHCRGAVFLDGEVHRTPELEDAVEAAARSFDGFHFGRFDLRAPSYEHFRRGEGIYVLELNGVSSEATHIYDPKHSLFQAWAILFRQWRYAYAIGDANRRAGEAPLTLGEVIGLIRAYRAR